MAQTYDDELKQITKIIGNKTIVDSINLNVEHGKFLSILGPSGCGKTTTLRMIGGFLLPDAGEVYIAGKNVTNDPPSKRETSMVFQDYALFPHMTVEKNIGFGLKMKGVSKEESQQRVKEALRIVGLEGYEKRKPSQLSGGQRQRIALARSLVLNPAILLLDEPLGALDAQIRKQMQLELKQIQRSLGQTFIYVTHDQEEAMTMSDMVAIMRAGKIEQIGSPEEVYDNPVNLFVSKFLGECSNFKGNCDTTGLVSNCLPVEIQARHTDTPFEGECELCIRPEYVKVFASDDSDSSGYDYSIPAVLSQNVFKGLNSRLIVKCGEHEFISEMLGKSTLVPGSAVNICFNKNDAFVVKADTDPSVDNEKVD